MLDESGRRICGDSVSAPAPISDKHDQGLVHIQTQASDGIPGLKYPRVLDQYYRPLTANPQSGRNGHSLSLTANRNQIER